MEANKRITHYALRLTHHISRFTLLLLLLAFAVPVAAQAVTVKIFGFDAGSFPRVRAFVSVTDERGRAVVALQKEAFKIVEDGRDAQIVALNVSDEPIYVGLVIDRSGSMNEQNKLRDALAAARAFVNEMRAQDEAFVTMFDDTTTPLVDFTSNHAALLNALGRITSGGGTAFYDATYTSAEKFKARQDKVKKALILLTDGLDNRSRHALDAAIARAREFGVAVYTIGLGNDADQARLKRLAEQTGGQFFFAPSGEDLKRLYLLIAEQLQKEYAVDFNSPRPLADGTQRRVKVTVTLPSGETKTADGLYVAGFLFNRIRADWIVGALLGLLLLTMGVAPTVGKMAFNALAGPQPSKPEGSPRPFGFGAHPPPPPAPQPPTPPLQPPPPVPGAQCPHCGRAVRVGARFCPHCAQPLGAAPPPAPPAVPASLCPQCGKPVRAGARFCGNCRYKL
jgi:Ca-activated chloride channel family protein